MKDNFVNKIIGTLDENIMPDAFWVTDTISKDSDEKNVSLSFDEQISALLAGTQEEVNTRKR